MRGSEVLLGSLLAAVGLDWDPRGQEREFGMGPKASPSSPISMWGIWAAFGTRTGFSKALGTVSHDILTDRLRKCWINGLGRGPG